MTSDSQSADAADVAKPHPHPVAIWFLITAFASSAAILIRLCNVPATSIGFWRVMGASVILGPVWFAQWRRSGQPAFFARGTIVTGLFLGLHFASWSWAVQNTTLANAALFIGLQPLMAPFVARPLLGERLNRWETFACGLASLGMVWILGRQFALEREHLPGTLTALGSAFLCATYFVLTRKHRVREHAILFTVPVYLTAAAVQAVCAFAINGGIYVGDQRTALALFALALFPTVGGHTLAIYLLRHVKSQMVTLSIPAQFVIVTIIGLFSFRETPTVWFLIGAALVLVGVAVGVLKSEAPGPVAAKPPR